MPGDYMNMLFSIGANVCYMTFNKPHFSEVHESRINENTETFGLPINHLAALREGWEITAFLQTNPPTSNLDGV